MGAEVVVDYKRQAFDALLQGYDLVLGTLRGDAIERSLSILQPGGGSCCWSARRMRPLRGRET